MSDPTLGPQSGASRHPLRCERLFPVQTGAAGLDSSSWDLRDLILELEEQTGDNESSFWPVDSGVEGLRPQLLSHRTGMPRRRRRLGDWSLILLCLLNTRSLPDKTKRSYDTRLASGLVGFTQALFYDTRLATSESRIVSAWRCLRNMIS